MQIDTEYSEEHLDGEGLGGQKGRRVAMRLQALPCLITQFYIKANAISFSFSLTLSLTLFRFFLLGV